MSLFWRIAKFCVSPIGTHYALYVIKKKIMESFPFVGPKDFVSDGYNAVSLEFGGNDRATGTLLLFPLSPYGFKFSKLIFKVNRCGWGRHLLSLYPMASFEFATTSAGTGFVTADLVGELHQ